MKLVAAVLLAAGVALTGCAGGQGSQRTVELTMHHSRFSLDELHVRPGETIRFVLRNTDPIPHELIVGDQSVQDIHELGTESHHGERPGEVSVAPGSTAVTTFRFGAAGGRLLFGCHLPGHWAYGMRGTITVA
jgi:uncharacterized cupredoxin-like copper-binding protein